MPAPTYDFDATLDDEIDAPLVPQIKPAEKPAPKTPQEAEERGKDAPPAHARLTLQFAKEYDISDEEVAEMSVPELERAVQIAHRNWLKHSKDLSRNVSIQDAAKSQAPAPVEVAPEVPAEEEDEYAEFADDLHPKVIAAIKKGRDKDKKVIEGLQKKIDEAEGRQQAMYREQVYDAVDAEFAKMSPAVKKLIGEGDRQDIADGSLQQTIRRHILTSAEADKTAGLTFAEKMHKAAKALAPSAQGDDEPPEEEEPVVVPIRPAKPAPAQDPATGQFAKRAPADREAAWKAGGTAKPTQRESPLPTGERKAMETARKYMLAAGMLDESDLPANSFPKSG